MRIAEKLTGHSAEAVAFGTEAPYLQRLGCETLVLGPGDIACAHQPGNTSKCHVCSLRCIYYGS